MLFRTGIGFDSHRFIKGKKLILCGEVIPYEYGLDGHSDADAPVHAIMDALLSAAGLPDIGVLFPNTAKEFENADSMELLKTVFQKIKDAGFTVNNLSIVIITDKPKLSEYINKMKSNLSSVLETSAIGISAKTTEGLMSNEGLYAYANCSLEGVKK
jgi:2-C-methyl-D-erythritol 2,4-cyclodiphosphate synthase